VKHYRTIFISDTHLGTRGCKADLLCDFLKHNTCDELYLVGDIIDGWRIKRGWYWPQSHTNVIRRILTAAKRDTRVYYILGNHDEDLRKFVPFDISFGRIAISNKRTHVGATGKQYLVVHGDQFDAVMQKNKWLMHIGDSLYNTLLSVNSKLNRVRGWLGLDYWSLSQYLKSKTKHALNFIYGFEEHLAMYCRKKGFDGVICGHIHTPAIKRIEGIEYMNDGDWVESCSALVEHHDGTWALVYHHCFVAQASK